MEFDPDKIVAGTDTIRRALNIPTAKFATIAANAAGNAHRIFEQELYDKVLYSERDDIPDDVVTAVDALAKARTLINVITDAYSDNDTEPDDDFDAGQGGGFVDDE